MSCLLVALLEPLFGLVWYVLLGDDGVGVGVAGHTPSACSDLEMPESDCMDKDVMAIGFCEQREMLTSSG
jgi:hypothetical protein